MSNGPVRGSLMVAIANHQSCRTPGMEALMDPGKIQCWGGPIQKNYLNILGGTSKKKHPV